MGTRWRNHVCDGCSLRCRYRDFKVFDRDGFRETQQQLFVDSDDPRDWRYKRRGTVLGMMHAHKRDCWESMVNGCPYWEEE